MLQQQQQALRMQILNHQQQMQQQMANEKMQRPPNMPNMANMPNAQNPNQPQQMQVPPNAAGMPAVRKKIWTGVLEWNKKDKTTTADKVPQQIPCYVTAKEGEPEMYVLISFSHLKRKCQKLMDFSLL